MNLRDSSPVWKWLLKSSVEICLSNGIVTFVLILLHHSLIDKEHKSFANRIREQKRSLPAFIIISTPAKYIKTHHWPWHASVYDTYSAAHCLHSVFFREMPVFMSATLIISGQLIWGAFEPTTTFSSIEIACVQRSNIGRWTLFNHSLHSNMSCSTYSNSTQTLKKL